MSEEFDFVLKEISKENKKVLKDLSPILDSITISQLQYHQEPTEEKKNLIAELQHNLLQLLKDFIPEQNTVLYNPVTTTHT